MPRKLDRKEPAFTARPDLIFPLVIEGVVVVGDQRGRELGYPTANVEVPANVIAPEGVFAGTVERADGTLHRSAVSVGRRETFYLDGGPSLVEAFLLDFSGDLYGEMLVVTLVQELRLQTKFDSVETLIDQIAHDVAAVRSIVALPEREAEPRGFLVPAVANSRGATTRAGRR